MCFILGEKKKMVQIIISIIFIMFFALFFSRNGNAASLGTGNPIVPKGAIRVDGIFGSPNIKIKNGGSAGGTGVIAGPSGENGGVPFSEVVLGGSQNAVSIWSNDNYRMDFSKSFTGRAYVNFGQAAADGFAFVMHNDESKTKALTTATGVDDGQNLGVYGGTKAWKKSIFDGLITPETYAIKHSVAIEFDLFANTDGAAVFDKKYPYLPHIAHSFPGDLEKGYIPAKLFGGGDGTNWINGSPAQIHHYEDRTLNGAIGDNVQDGTWYEFRYDFDVSSGKFTYYLKNPMNNAQTEVTEINRDDLNAELQLAANGNKAYWGFTGSNGKASGEVKFAFTEVPVDLDAALKNDVQANGKSIVDVAEHETFSPEIPAAQFGNKVKMTSRLTVNQGESNVNLTTMETVLDPKIFDLSKEKAITNVRATLADGTLYPGQFTVNATTGAIKATFTTLNVVSGQVIDFQLEGQTFATGTTQKSYFSSTVSGVELANRTPVTFLSNQVPFWLYQNNPTTLSWDNPAITTDKSINLDKSELAATGVSSKFYYQDIDVNDSLQFYVKKGTEVIQKLPLITTPGGGSLVESELTIPSDKLAYGDNRFVVEVYQVTALSGEVKQAATLTLNITVTGKLAFQAAPAEFKWTNRLAGETKGTMTRDVGNKQQLSVLDSRENASTWSIGVSATTQANTPFHLIWQGKGASQTTAITNQTQIAMKAGDVAAANYVSTQEWSESEGVLLQSDEYLRVGDYSGKITVHWQLYDTATAD